jgi:hypothetical protein
MGDIASEIRDLVRQARKQGFEVTQTQSGHMHVERHGRRAVLSVSPSATNSVMKTRQLLEGIGFVPPEQFHERQRRRRQRRTVDLTGVEGQLLLRLSRAGGPMSALSLASECGVPIGTAMTALNDSLGRYPNLRRENTLWVWDATETVAFVEPEPELVPQPVQQTGMREFRYPLRPGVIVHLWLPQDVTQPEKEKLLKWMKWIKAQEVGPRESVAS